MKVCGSLGSERNIGRLPFVGAELFGKIHRSEHWSVHSRVTDKMELRDLVAFRFDFAKKTQYFALALDRAQDDSAVEPAVFLLARKCTGHDRELPTALSVKRRIDDDDEVASHRSSGSGNVCVANAQNHGKES